MKLTSQYFINCKNYPYIIAEIGVNHEGSLETAKKLIQEAKEGGAHAAKFQTYKAGKIASKHSPAYWDTSKEPTSSQFKLFQKYDGFGEEEYKELAAYCRLMEIDFLSTPFDADAIDFLDPLMPLFKVASADITNIPLLRHIASKKKPVILSTGASTLAEIDMAVNELTVSGCDDITLLHCILNYPTQNNNAYLDMLEGIKRAFPTLKVGYSDHTLPDDKMLILTSAWLKGAAVIEKHFTNDKTLPGNDHYHAMDQSDLNILNSNIKLLKDILGTTQHKAPLDSESGARLHARRSIVAVRDIAIGEVITEDLITYKRPAHGISPLHWDEVIGKKVVSRIEEDTPLQWSFIK
ncbi:MAG: N-acetylneuraminate synthase family protein [Oceanospirillaceae bacterium]|nr:N-acetylneuraminate synthase family protein [Oceanospirillaceae bacterium]